MVESNPVSKTLSTLQSVYDLAKGIADLEQAHAVKSQLVDLMDQVVSARESAMRTQQRESSLLQEIDSLKKQIDQMEQWEAEKERYQLTDFGGGTFAYLLKPGMENGEPPHRLCPACFENGKKSILQARGQNAYSQDTYDCPACYIEDLACRISDVSVQLLKHHAALSAHYRKSP